MKKFLTLSLVGMMMILAVGCAKTPAETTTEAPNGVETEATTEAAANATKYEGTATGFNDSTIKVSVTMDGDKITAVEVLEHGETAGVGDTAMETIIGQVVEGQSLAVDAVAGATYSSNGIKDAIANALTENGVDASEKFGYEAAAIEIPCSCTLIYEVAGPQEGVYEEGYRYFEYKTDGTTCSDRITFSIKEDDLTVHDMAVFNGCDGTSKGFTILADTMTIDYCVERMGGIICDGSNGSSCPDQCAKALTQAKHIIEGTECTFCK